MVGTGLVGPDLPHWPMFHHDAARSGRNAKLRLALGCWWAASVIAHDWAVSGVAATTPGSSRTAAAYAGHGPGFLSPRTAALILIACLHLALVYFLALGLGNRTVAALPSFTVTSVRTSVYSRGSELPNRPTSSRARSSVARESW